MTTSTRAVEGFGGDGGCWRTRLGKIAVSSGPSLRPQPAWERVWAPRLRGSQTAVVTRRLNRPRSKEVAEVPGCWQETAGAQAGCGNRCEVKGIVCTYVIKSGAHTHTGKVNK